MENEAVIRKHAAKKLIILGLAATIGLLSGCVQPARRAAPPAPPLPVSHWGDNYFYNFEPPSKLPAASVKATIIVVNPFYKDAESALIDPTYAQVGKGFSKSMGVDLDKIIIAKGMTSVGPYLSLDDVTYPDKKNADITLAPRVFLTTETKYGEWINQKLSVGGTETEIFGIGVAVENSGGHLRVTQVMKNSPALSAGVIAGEEIVNIDGQSASGMDVYTFVRLARGSKNTQVTITIKKSLEESKVITLSRTVPLKTTEGGTEKVFTGRKFELKIGGWVAYEMREPLSGEKMWVKKLEMEGSVASGWEIYEAKPVYETRYGGQYHNVPYQHLVRYDQGPMVYNGKAEAVADALKNYYPVIMEKAWTYIDTDEIINLKDKTREIRQLKRY